MAHGRVPSVSCGELHRITTARAKSSDTRVVQRTTFRDAANVCSGQSKRDLIAGRLGGVRHEMQSFFASGRGSKVALVYGTMHLHVLY